MDPPGLAGSINVHHPKLQIIANPGISVRFLRPVQRYLLENDTSLPTAKIEPVIIDMICIN